MKIYKYMLLKELREKVIEAGGEMVVGCVRFNCKEEGDLDVYKVDGSLVAWASSSNDVEKKVEEVISVANEVLKDGSVKALVDFVQYIGVDVGILPIEIEKPVVEVREVMKVDVESQIEASKLRGMVDAYEKIVLGRDVTISK